MASIYASLIIMAILGLIVFSFSFLMRREYIQAQDRKANTQARYAAETAINDARRQIYMALNDRLADSSQSDILQDPFRPDDVVSNYGCANRNPTKGYLADS